MDVRYATHPEELAGLSPEELRARFVVSGLFSLGQANMALSLSDRLVIGGVVPSGRDIVLDAPDELRSKHFCDRREMAIVCLAGQGAITLDGTEHHMDGEDILYVGRGAKEMTFQGDDATFYFVSAPAHQTLPTLKGTRATAETHRLGDAERASARTLRKYVHEDGIGSCELAVGITTLDQGSVWNTMPCHTHERRTEIYLYFALPDGERVVHLCGRPYATRSLILGNQEAVISPPWSIHTGAGTAPYRFVWSTGGENLAYNDMDLVLTETLR
jgi:4-deoxy-L-threo-5-hexosulose-uronate ketol-isomerase